MLTFTDGGAPSYLRYLEGRYEADRRHAARRRRSQIASSPIPASNSQEPGPVFSDVQLPPEAETLEGHNVCTSMNHFYY